MTRTMTRAMGYLMLSRPINLVTGLFTVFAGTAILGALNDTITLAILSVVVVFYNAAGNAINDYYDYEIDLINRPNRPLSRGILARREARVFATVLFIVGSVISVLLPPSGMVIAVAVAMPLMILYSWKLKRTPLAGNLVIALILGLVFIFIGAGHGSIKPMIIPAGLAFGLTLIREIVKDMADIKGDRAAGAGTLPERMGLKKTSVLVFTLSVLFGGILLIPYPAGIYGWKFLAVAFAGVTLPLWFGAGFLLYRPEDQTAGMFSKLLKLSTVLGVLGIYLG